MHIKLGILLLDRLELPRRLDRDIPRTRLLPDLLVLAFQTINSQGNSNVQIRTFLEDPCDVGKYSLLNLPVRHNVNRLELIVGIKGTGDFRQVFSCKRLAAGKYQHTQVATQSLSNTVDFLCLHLEFLARTVVQLVGEKAVGAAHIAD